MMKIFITILILFLLCNQNYGKNSDPCYNDKNYFWSIDSVITIYESDNRTCYKKSNNPFHQISLPTQLVFSDSTCFKLIDGKYDVVIVGNRPSFNFYYMLKSEDSLILIEPPKNNIQPAPSILLDTSYYYKSQYFLFDIVNDSTVILESLNPYKEFTYIIDSTNCNETNKSEINNSSITKQLLYYNRYKIKN